MQKGKIISIDRTQGYGFIAADDGTKIFFHQRWLRKVRFRDLKEGDEVAFSVSPGPRGPRAYHLVLASQECPEETAVPGDDIFKSET